jgi:flagellar hook-basal body complex protein FliE
MKVFRLKALQQGYTPEQISSYLSSGDTFEDRSQNWQQESSIDSTNSLPGQQSEQPKGGGGIGGFLKEAVKDVANPFLRAGTTAVDVVEGGINAAQAVGNRITGNKEAERRNIQEGFDALRERHLPFFGTIKPFTGVNLDTAGAAASAASNFIGGEGAVGTAKNLGKGALKQAIRTGVKEGAVAGGLAGLGGELQSEDPTLGGSVKNTLKGAAIGGTIGGVVSGVPAAGVQGFRAVRGTAREVKNFIAPEVDVALIKAIKPSANNTGFKQALQTALPDINETSELAKTPIKNLENLSQAIKATKNRIWDTYQALLGPNADATIDGNKVADSMMSSIDRRFASQNPQRVERIVAIADTYRKPISLKDAEDFLQSANNDLYSYYAKNKVGKKVALGDPETAYIVKEAEALRDALYGKLNDLTGENAGALKQKYGALLNIENEVIKRINVAARQNPENLAEQISLAQGVGRVGKSVLNAELGDAIQGAGQIVASRYLKNKNTSDALIQSAFARLRKRPVKK